MAMWAIILVSVWRNMGYYMVIYLAALQGVPDELYEASEVDGAGKVYQFFKITVPYIYPVLITTTLLRSIWIFNFADLIYSITRGGPAGSTEIMTSYMLNLIMFQSDFGMASAVGIVIILILLVWCTLYLKISKVEEAGDY